jgi:choline dehydrogenase-like flavoprotein
MAKIDARKIVSGSRIQADVCVIGAGAAGISIARELSGTGLDVIVLESGGMKPEKATTELYDGKTRGDGTGSRSYLQRSRLRYFGGTTNHWDGACAPLEPWDLTGADWFPNPGWPIDRATLDPYYDRAAPVIGIHPFDYDLGYFAENGWPTYDFAPTSGLLNRPFQFSTDRRFKAKFGEELFASKNVRVYLWANVVELVPRPDGGALSHVDVRTLEGKKKFSVSARCYVLATGGIENARLLLASQSVHEQGLGNENDLVGRFFMDHVYFRRMTMVLTQPLKSMVAYRRKVDKKLGGRSQVVLSFTPEFRRKHGLLDSTIRLEGSGPAKNRPPLSVAMRATTEALSPGTRKSLWFNVRLITELAPDENNRIVLEPTTDALGVRRATLHWKLTELDRRSIEKTTQLFTRVAPIHLGGRIHLTPHLKNGRVQSHHIGTTRMHVDPKRGVVDANCRLHGFDDLYLAGSSVFPSSAAVNPTFTIVALALRIADDVKQRLG